MYLPPHPNSRRNATSFAVVRADIAPTVGRYRYVVLHARNRMLTGQYAQGDANMNRVLPAIALL